MPQRMTQIVKPVVQPMGSFVRLLREEDIAEVMQIRREIGVHDVSSSILTWSRVDPEGIRVIETESGKIVGTCSAVKQHDHMHFAGLYGMRDEYRGCGIGVQAWNACNKYIGSRNAANNAVPEHFELYRHRAGFPIIETEFKCVKNYTTEPVDPKNLSINAPQGVTIEPFDKSHLPHIYAYDLALVGYRRERTLELSCQEQDSRTIVAFKDGVCVGFGSIKTSCLGAGRVGPLYADDPQVAEVMLRNLIISLPMVSCFAMMTISTNVPAIRFLNKLGCPQIGELRRMYRSERMRVDTSKVFALFDLNFAPF